MAMPPQDAQPELALLALMKQGDETAFVRLYRRHRDAVYRLALLYSGSAANAADATQETFIHFMTRPGQYDPMRGTLAAWLCGVARNIARKVWTIPAGRIGNRSPIRVTKESWYAHDLQVLVYARHNDPRTGESIYRLASIKRGEPAADLFKVPEGYTVKGRDPRGTSPEAKAPNPPD